jgi:hypothetical protein
MPPRRSRLGGWKGFPGFPQGFRTVAPMREQRLPLLTAKAIAAFIQGAGLGRCAVLPGTKGWDVLVELGPVPGQGELVLLATLGDAWSSGLLAAANRAFGEGRNWRATRSRTEPLPQAEAQIREALVDVFAAKAQEEAGEEAQR